MDNKIYTIFKNVYADSFNSYCDFLDNKIKNKEKLMVITANPEIINKADNDDEIKKILLDKKNSICPDGIGVVKSGRLLGFNIKERITGVDLAKHLLEYANKNHNSLYILGSKQNVLDMMSDVLKNEYPNINVLGLKNGYSKNKDEDMNEIVKVAPDIVLVALGVPNQEKLIYKHLQKFKKGIFIGVGGSIDVLSGFKKRAPKIFVKTNTEWLYRIVCEPSRLKRFFDNNVKFLFKIKKLKNKIGR